MGSKHNPFEQPDVKNVQKKVKYVNQTYKSLLSFDLMEMTSHDKKNPKLCFAQLDSG